MSWTSIPNANLAIGAPIRSVDQLALRDNPIAIAEGATGAPRVRAEALNGGQSGSAPIFAARAWVNFNGTGVVAIRASGNVSSITDNGVGDYTVNFTTAMPDANYVANTTSCTLTTANMQAHALIAGTNTTGAALKSTTQIQVHTGSSNTGAKLDYAEVNVSILR